MVASFFRIRNVVDETIPVLILPVSLLVPCVVFIRFLIFIRFPVLVTITGISFAISRLSVVNVGGGVDLMEVDVIEDNPDISHPRR